MTNIYSPFTLGKLQLQNRFVMAPMTRARANADGGRNEFGEDH